MAGTYRRINYSLRPAKAVERKMICETVRRLYSFGKIETYRYIGFGSVYFSDFQLFHRELGMENMISIEKDAHARDCFEFNKPYKCVNIEYKPSSRVLPGLDWQFKTIVWLDYESRLDEPVLSDVGSVCAGACSGSLLIVTVNAHPERDPDEATRKEFRDDTGEDFNLDDYRLRELRKRVGDSLPPEVNGSELRGKGLALISRKILESTIREALSARNGVLPPEKRLAARQILNFRYSDGAIMSTHGWVFLEAGEQAKFDACSFNELSFTRFGEEAYSIKVPCLTIKEMRHLNSQLPRLAAGQVSLPGVPKADIEHYAELYRYFPTFAEAIFT